MKKTGTLLTLMLLTAFCFTGCADINNPMASFGEKTTQATVESSSDTETDESYEIIEHENDGSKFGKLNDGKFTVHDVEYEIGKSTAEDFLLNGWGLIESTADDFIEPDDSQLIYLLDADESGMFAMLIHNPYSVALKISTLPIICFDETDVISEQSLIQELDLINKSSMDCNIRFGEPNKEYKDTSQGISIYEYILNNDMMLCVTFTNGTASEVIYGHQVDTQ